MTMDVIVKMKVIAHTSNSFLQFLKKSLGEDVDLLPDLYAKTLNEIVNQQRLQKRVDYVNRPSKTTAC